MKKGLWLVLILLSAGFDLCFYLAGKRAADRWYAAHPIIDSCRPVILPDGPTPKLVSLPYFAMPKGTFCVDNVRQAWPARIEGTEVTCYVADAK